MRREVIRKLYDICCYMLSHFFAQPKAEGAVFTMIANRWPKLSWQLATWVGAALYVLFSIIYLMLGQPNADEGAYLYAGKLVFQGNLPYRDFAYPQMPLLPYIYGLPQLISPSLYLGRATSMLFSITTFLICILLARRYAGRMGTGLTALMLGTFTFGIYFVIIVKTYAFLLLLFALTFFALSSSIPDKWKYLLAVTFSFLATMIRLSAVVFMIPIVIYCLTTTFRRPTKFFPVLALCIVLAVGSSFFFFPDLEAAKWNILTHNIAQWGNASFIMKIKNIVFYRIPSFIQYYILYLLLLFSLLFLAVCDAEIRARIKPYLHRNLPLLVTGIGLALFSLVHFGAGSWYMEYFVPAVMLFLPIIAILFSKIYPLKKSFTSKFLLQCLLIAALLLTPFIHNIENIDITGKMPLEKIREVSMYISKYSSLSDRIFALEALWTVIESNRSVLPGMTMVQFSYQDISKEEAEKLKLINGEIAVKYINNCMAKIIVLTEGDWLMFKRTGYDELVRQALHSRYDLVLKEGAFGQQYNNVYVYLCRVTQE